MHADDAIVICIGFQCVVHVAQKMRRRQQVVLQNYYATKLRDEPIDPLNDGCGNAPISRLLDHLLRLAAPDAPR